MNLFKFIKIELMYLCLTKLMSKYEKKYWPNFCIYTLNSSKKVRVIVFPLILDRSSFLGKATNFFIDSLNKFVLKKYCQHIAGFFQSGDLFWFLYMQKYLISCKLDWEENLFYFYVESKAFRIKIQV